jgi:hypothetical protein
VNLTILPSISPPPYDDYRDVIVNEKVSVEDTAGNNPGPFVDVFKAQGITTIHKCTRSAACAQGLVPGCGYCQHRWVRMCRPSGEDDVLGLVLIPAATARLRMIVLAS